MSGWSSKKLGNIITLKRGYDLPRSYWKEGPYPVVTSTGIMGFHDECKVKGPGVVTGRTGTLGEVFYVNSDYWPHNTALYVQDFKGNNPRYVFYLLKTLGFKSRNAASAVPTVNRNYLHEIVTTVPDLKTQNAIASLLSAYDDLIENNRRRIQILEEMARAIYREWFVHFRFPGHEEVKMVDSEMGEIPQGWKTRKLGEVIELAYGKGLREKERVPGQYPVIGSSGIIGHHQKALVEGPGVVVGRKGNLGSVHWSQKSFVPIDTTFYVKTSICLHYVYYHLQDMNFIDTHTSVPGMSRESAYLKDFLMPPTDLLNQFHEAVDMMFALVDRLQDSNEVLSRMRDTLLPKLVSGKIDVSGFSIDPQKDNQETSKYKEQSTLDKWTDGDGQDADMGR